MSTFEHLSLSQRIAALEAAQTGDMIPAEQVRELVAAVKEMFGQQGDKSGNNERLYQELGELAKFINNAKKELQDVKGSAIAEEHLPNATNQLDAIVQMTEQATGRIMDECDRLTMFHNDLRERLIAMDPPLDPDALAGVDDAINQAAASITHIFEACNFQDITGQRVQKVVRALQEIERQVLRMVVVFGLMENKHNLDEETAAELREDAELLNGPQLSGQGLDQDEIDSILSKLL
ncbi:MAG: protein phosphatase CheZ [Blastochloris viridis]|uniref:Protein phosphatase CheZ n=1 Tax=Blastochloris viridis TaxID=1079 RepID=A0A6N4R958_BLAVI|nr:MAG: protein phosphatase CheZ [Blastochloris viridis]